MKKLIYTVSAVAFITSTYASSPASAAGTYFLQLGSFYTRADAEQKWQDSKSQNAELFSGLNVHIAEVSIPPENKISYRTQVGPVASRSKADELCSAIQEKSAECYVVETAMTIADTEKKPVSMEKPVTADTKKKKNKGKANYLEEKASPSKSAASAYIPGREPKFLDQDSPFSDSAEAKAKPPEAVAVTQPEDKVAPASVPVQKAEVVSDNVTSKREPAFLDSDTKANDKTMTVETPVIESTATVEKEEERSLSPKEEQKPGFFSRLFGSSRNEAKEEVIEEKKKQPASIKKTSPSSGDVRVAEAIRVPLSKENEEQSATVITSPSSAFEETNLPQVNARGMYWAQINYFKDEDHAQSFYQEFHDRNPDISEGVRIRITHPYNSSRHRVSLRIGTFSNLSDIKSVCAIATVRGLSCTTVKDIASSQPLSESSGVSDSSPFSEQKIESEQKVGAEYWVQLGSYPSPDEAWDRWSTLRKRHKKLLSRSTGDVVAPENSSADAVIYRLRSGPFASKNAADKICDKLEKSGVDCLVVNEK